MNRPREMQKQWRTQGDCEEGRTGVKGFLTNSQMTWGEWGDDRDSEDLWSEPLRPKIFVQQVDYKTRHGFNVNPYFCLMDSPLVIL